MKAGKENHGGSGPLPGWRLQHLAEVDSTNRRAWELAAAGTAAGLVVFADRQTGGRGRRGRQWLAPPGKDLTFSLIMRPELSPERVPLLSLVAGAAGLSLLRPVLPSLQIKWPNDLYCGGRKLAGILAEASLVGRRVDFVILGVGLNVNSEAADFPAALRGTATSLFQLVGRRCPRLELLRSYLEQLENWYSEFVRRGFAGRLRSFLEEHSYLRQRWVTVEVDGRPLRGQVIGLDESGRLLLRNDGGSVQAVAAGEATVRAID